MAGADPDLVAVLGAIAASAGALARTTHARRVRVPGLGLLLAGWLALAWSVLPGPITDRPALAIGGLAAATGIGWLAAGAVRGRERWLLALGAAVLTVRIPVPTGEGDAMLLLPLYAVVGLGGLALLRTELAQVRRGERSEPDRGGATRLLDVGTAALPALATISLTWSWAPTATTELLAFYLVPFVLAYALVRAWLAAGVDVRPASIALVGSTVAFAVVGLVQAATHQVWWNPKVVDANRFRPDFRTNSLFWDPNMYGRALVIAALAVVAWLLVARLDRRRIAGAVVVLAILVAALWHTFSQSSWVALAAGLLLLGILTLPPRPRRWVAALVVLVVLVGGPFAAGQLEGDDTDGRAAVVRTGVSLAAERPIAGWGAGTFEVAARARELEKGDREPALVASHTTPVTVFAELGVLGAIAYLTLLTSAAVTVLARWRQTSSPASAARRAGSDPAATGWPIAPIGWASAALAALFAHSLLYAGFFEDPTTWVVLAVLASLPVTAIDAATPTPAD